MAEYKTSSFLCLPSLLIVLVKAWQRRKLAFYYSQKNTFFLPPLPPLTDLLAVMTYD